MGFTPDKGPQNQNPPPDYSQAEGSAEFHEKYYLSDDYLVLLVENKLFRVDARWLQENSAQFAKIRRMSGLNSPEQPLAIPGIHAAELETLLHFVDESMKEGFSMGTDQWIRLLSIAHKLELPTVKPRAIREVFAGPSPPPPVRQLALYEAHDVLRADVAPAVRALILRTEPLCADELMELSYKTAAEIGGLREEHLRNLLKPFGTWADNPEKSVKALVARWNAQA
ncbi:hypothetical protein K488DRAFT_84971 [Vararia minispora EC-137]|uniref:Uncharacterized protein n=1 Tax=Vararia minispora EC-137 TaxID=1314806 RepID=A0ACB8QNW9_9AGAM|nr:hypothetical protein K488DRAFT_84971 [Vararia minispora EC-137]